MNFRILNYADDHVKLMELQAQIDALQAEHDAKAENWLDLTRRTRSIYKNKS